MLLLQGPATELLEVDVQQAPDLYQETSPSVWQPCHDFTGGEASCLRYANTISCLRLCSLQQLPALILEHLCT